MRQYIKIILTAFYLLITIYSNKSFAGNNVDTLYLKQAGRMVNETYPSVTLSDIDIRIAEIHTGIEKDIYMPSVTGEASYLWIDPISKLTIGDKTVHINANNNTNIGITIKQLIWDFGKSRSKIEAAKIQYELAELEKNQTLQNLTLKTIRNYYMTTYTRYSVNVKEKQMEDYAKLLEQTEIKRSSGSATTFDYLNTNSGYNAIKTEIIALNTAKEKQYVNISLLTDTLINDATLLSFPQEPKADIISLEDLISLAISNRIEMKIVNKKLELARQDLKTDERIFNPVLEAHVTGGMKSGYEPKVNDLKWNYGAGATLTAPIYVSNRSKQKSLGKAQINKSIANIDLIKKEITSQVADSYLTYREL